MFCLLKEYWVEVFGVFVVVIIVISVSLAFFFLNKSELEQNAYAEKMHNQCMNSGKQEFECFDLILKKKQNSTIIYIPR